MRKSIIKSTLLSLLGAAVYVGCTSTHLAPREEGTRQEKTLSTNAAASGEIITASSYQAGSTHVPQNTMDGNFNTRWSAEGDGQWIQYQLTAVKNVASVNIAFYQGDARSSKFDIQLSTDGSTWVTKFTGQSSGTSVNFESFRLTEITPAKFVRILGHGNTVNNWNSYTEVLILTPNDGYQYSFIQDTV